MIHVARKIAASIIFGGNMFKARFTVASTAPILFAVSEKAPAKMNIHSISIILLEPAPRLNVSMRSRIRPFATNAIAKMLEIRKATVSGIL